MKELEKYVPGENGDIISLKAWKSFVDSGGFIDYDGYGQIVVDGYKTGTYVNPSDYTNNKDYFKGMLGKVKILWYNR